MRSPVDRSITKSPMRGTMPAPTAEWPAVAPLIIWKPPMPSIKSPVTRLSMLSGKSSRGYSVSRFVPDALVGLPYHW
uniref:Uncharacterized protein n=1 Tax=uncultured marine virus TaxID=186617 RepID=A0A0F7L2W3_9VIRU|nr:hypothetical protein [uncultured marine virus]